MSGSSRSDLRAPFLRAHLRLDDDRGSRGEDVHQGPVPLGQVLVRGQAGGAEGAVQRAVAQCHRHRDVAPEPRHAGGRQLHRLGEVRQVRDDLGELLVEDRLAEGEVLLLLVALPEEERRRGVDHLEVLGRAVEPAQERDAEAQRLARRVQQIGDLLFGVRALPGHTWVIGLSA
jgi:hypothetical protein